MKAIVLAAGRGSRLGSMTDSKPKCLVELNGRTLLDRCLEALHAGGIREVVVIAGYLAESLRRPEVTLRVNREWARSGIVASLSEADDLLCSEPCLVSYSDIFYAPQIVRKTAEARGDIGVAYDPSAFELWAKRMEDPRADLETFRVSANGVIETIGGRLTDDQRLDGQFMGLLKFTPAGWRALKVARDELPAHRRAAVDMTSLLRTVVASRSAVVMGVANAQPWGEVDTPSDLHLYHELYPHV